MTRPDQLRCDDPETAADAGTDTGATTVTDTVALNRVRGEIACDSGHSPSRYLDEVVVPKGGE